MKRYIILCFLFSVLSSQLHAKIQKVIIYLVPWNVSTLTAIGPDEARKMASAKIEISGSYEAERFITFLESITLKEAIDTPVRDIRMVVDVFDDERPTWSFVASSFAIKSGLSGRTWLIDSAFRSRFAFYYEK